MSKPANVKLCQELYELTGWGYNFHAYGDGKHDLTDRMWRHWQAKTTGSEWWSFQDTYDRSYGSPLKDILVDSLYLIRKQQKTCIAWRKEQGMGSDDDRQGWYDYLRVKV